MFSFLSEKWIGSFPLSLVLRPDLPCGQFRVTGFWEDFHSLQKKKKKKETE